MSQQFRIDPEEKFDDETQELYKLRHSTDMEQILGLNKLNRNPSRGELPILVKLSSEAKNKNNGDLLSNHKVQIVGIAYTFFACNQYLKAFFPSGYLLRRSIPQSWGTYFQHRLPMFGVVLGIWYMTRYKMIANAPDLYDPSEE